SPTTSARISRAEARERPRGARCWRRSTWSTCSTSCCSSRRSPSSRCSRPAPERAVVLALAIPFALVLLVARPPQGAIRDWDSFAVPGIAIALAAAWTLARAIDAARAPRLAAPLALVAALTAIQWLAHFADAPRGRTRLEQLMLGPPAREAVDRARTWDFLGWRWFRDQSYERSTTAFEQAVDAAPSPRNLTHWAMAETMRGRPERALAIYRQAVERDSNLTLGWFG